MAPVNSDLLKGIGDRTATVAVVGAGYVGLPLAVETAGAGYTTVAFDKMAGKVESINAGKSYIDDVPTSVLEPLVKSKKLSASTDPDVLREGGRDHHLRAHAAQQDAATRTSPTSSTARRHDGAAHCRAAAAHRAGEHDLSRHHRRDAPAPAGGGGA